MLYVFLFRSKLILLLWMLTEACIASSSEVSLFTPSLSNAELQLFSDSSSSVAWGQLGLALLASGSPSAELVLSKSLSIGNNPEAIRGMATQAVLQNRISEALTLFPVSMDDPLMTLMHCSILQEADSIVKSDFLISIVSSTALPPEAIDLLGIRQLRVSGRSAAADSMCNLILSKGGKGSFIDLIYLDFIVNNYSPNSTDHSRIIDALKADVVFTGGVYFDNLINSLSDNIDDPDDAYVLGMLYYLSGELEIADEILSSVQLSSASVEQIALHANILTILRRYNSAKAILLEGFEIYPAHELLMPIYGKVLLKADRYFEAYFSMQKAVLFSNSPECMALQGIAAELAGEMDLAIEAYAPLLAMSQDSIVLINRTRCFIQDSLLNQTYTPLARERSWQNTQSGLRGRVSLSYFTTSGLVDQKSFSVLSNVSYSYGLWGSRISASGSYSNNSFPGSSTIYTQSRISTRFRHSFSYSLYGKAELNWEELENTTKRESLESLLGIGVSWSPVSSINFSPFLGVARIQDQQNQQSYQDVYNVIQPRLEVSLRNYWENSLSPSITFTGQISLFTEEADVYSGKCQSMVTSRISDEISISYSYKYEYWTSLIPEEEEDTENTTSSLHINLSF